MRSEDCLRKYVHVPSLPLFPPPLSLSVQDPWLVLDPGHAPVYCSVSCQTLIPYQQPCLPSSYSSYSCSLILLQVLNISYCSHAFSYHWGSEAFSAGLPAASLFQMWSLSIFAFRWTLVNLYKMFLFFSVFTNGCFVLWFIPCLFSIFHASWSTDSSSWLDERSRHVSWSGVRPPRCVR